MNIKQAGILLLLLFMVVHLHAQTNDSLKKKESLNQPVRKQYFNGYVLTGKITDAEDGQPVPFAPVFITGSQVGTVTDADGVYLIEVALLPGDSIKAQVIGYEHKAVKIDKGKKKATYNIELERSSNFMKEVIIKPGEDPAITLMKTVIRQKPVNSTSRLENYKYESYNKIELDLLNLNRKTFEKLPVPYLKQLGFVFENTDSNSYDQPFLPMYLTEALSDYYYQREPKKSKEYIKATQVKVINNKNMMNSMSQYLGKIYLAIDPYENRLPFFDKEFISPASNNALAFYKYRIRDTQQLYGHNIITLHFEPQRKGENCFEGILKIVDSVFAIQHISADMPAAANVNWVKKSSFYKEYEPFGDSLWFCTKENITAELAISQEGLVKIPGFIVRKTTSYKDLEVNKPEISETVNGKSFKKDVVVADSATSMGEAFWEHARHEKLNRNEQGIYDMYDSLENNRAYNRLKTLGKIFATGGYKFGPIEVGPYWNAYSNNQIEGNRFQFSLGTTPKLFKSIYLNGYLAYGVGDNRYKYNMNAFWLIKRQPRMYFNFAYTRDIDYTVNYYDRVTFNNIATSLIRKSGIPLKYVFADDVRFEFYHEFFSGFSQMLTVYHKIYDPYDPLPSSSIFRDVNGNASPTVTNSEVNVRLRYAYKERFLNGNYYRYSLGSKYPIVEMRLALGLKNVLKSDYDYQRVTLTVSDNWRIPAMGQLYVNLFMGKYFGTLPYPLLEQHPGNEYYSYNKYAFNMMNQYEFLSDQYIGINLEHSLGGGLLKYIPLVKKLKFRQFWTAKGLVGSLSDANKAYNFDKGFTFRSLDGKPYLEVGTGIENILKIFRVDFVWRVTPKSIPNENLRRDFGVFGSMRLNF
ncbi:MAG: carboxypeptidase-like regulatory domain-containing protein [Chitinophagaceae bacterium]|nr:carboxypeptidase-like regulatory domain-containing protein [Chitinophagaceae bacterium]MCB9044727.1 carboxypeptidase-like regulatory domain-containing protein [Chitinophagales bacterium]